MSKFTSIFVLVVFTFLGSSFAQSESDCWSKINNIYKGEVEHGEAMSALADRDV